MSFKKMGTAMVIVLMASVTWAQVDLNKASEIELDGLKGLGPAVTREVINERQKAAFHDWVDVMRRVKGIGPQKAASLSKQGVHVQGQGYAQPHVLPSQKP